MLPKKDTSYTGYYFSVKKLAYSKTTGGLKGVPVQSIVSYKLRDFYKSESFKDLFRKHWDRNERKKQKKKRGLIENLALGIYSKIGYRPWILSKNASKYFRSTIYVGYDISYDPKHGNSGAGAIVVFDSIGQVIDWFEVDLEIEEGDKIKPHSYERFLESIISSARNFMKDFDVVVFHRDGDFKYNELELIENYMKKEGYKFIAIEILKAKSTPILKEVDGKIKVAETGYWAKIGLQFSRGKPYLTFIVQTRGSEIPGIYANALKYRLVRWNFKYDTNELFEDLAAQIVNLCRLDYATKIGVSKLPITLHFAHKAANIKRNRISLADFERGKVNNVLYMI